MNILLAAAIAAAMVASPLAIAQQATDRAEAGPEMARSDLSQLAIDYYAARADYFLKKYTPPTEIADADAATCSDDHADYRDACISVIETAERQSGGEPEDPVLLSTCLGVAEDRLKSCLVVNYGVWLKAQTPPAESE